MTTALVTGGCGFIGSHFVRLVYERTKWRIINLDKLTYAGDPERLSDLPAGQRYRFVRGDITDRDLVARLFQEERPQVVLNFAAESHVDRSILDPAPFLHANVVGVQVLLEAAREFGVERFVQISTDEVYGDRENCERATEESALRPGNPYAASKAAADLLCLAYRRTYGIPVLITRGSNTYGPWQFPEKLIPAMIRHALADEPLPVYGDGMQRRDWLHVSDHSEAVLLVVERGKPGGVYNIASGDERTNLEVIRMLRELLAVEGATRGSGVVPEIRHVPDRPGHDRRYAMDASIIRALGWAPRVSFEEGLSTTVRWYREHREWLARASSGEYQGYHEAVYVRYWRTRG